MQQYHHPDLHDESLHKRADPSPGPCHSHNDKDAICAGTLLHEQPDNIVPASQSSQDLLRRLKRGHLLRYEREEEQDELPRTSRITRIDQIKREESSVTHL